MRSQGERGKRGEGKINTQQRRERKKDIHEKGDNYKVKFSGNGKFDVASFGGDKKTFSQLQRGNI